MRRRQIADPEQMTAALFELLQRHGPITVPTDARGRYAMPVSLVPVATESARGVLVELVDLSTLRPDELAEVLYLAGRSTAVSLDTERFRSKGDLTPRGNPDCGNPDCEVCHPDSSGRAQPQQVEPEPQAPKVHGRRVVGDVAPKELR